MHNNYVGRGCEYIYIVEIRCDEFRLKRSYSLWVVTDIWEGCVTVTDSCNMRDIKVANGFRCLINYCGVDGLPCLFTAKLYSPNKH